MSILNKYQQQLSELNVALPFMEGREKTEMKEFVLSHLKEDLKINNVGFMELPDDDGVLKEVGVITVAEDNNHFMFVGQAVTDTLQKIVEMVGEDLDALMQEGLPVQFDIRKSKNKREYVAMKVMC